MKRFLVILYRNCSNTAFHFIVRVIIAEVNNFMRTVCRIIYVYWWAAWGGEQTSIRAINTVLTWNPAACPAEIFVLTFSQRILNLDSFILSIIHWKSKMDNYILMFILITQWRSMHKLACVWRMDLYYHTFSFQFNLGVEWERARRRK